MVKLTIHVRKPLTIHLKRGSAASTIKEVPQQAGDILDAMRDKQYSDEEITMVLRKLELQLFVLKTRADRKNRRKVRKWLREW